MTCLLSFSSKTSQSMSLWIFLKRTCILLHNPAIRQSSLIPIIIKFILLNSFLFSLSVRSFFFKNYVKLSFRVLFLLPFYIFVYCTYTHPSLSLIFFFVIIVLIFNVLTSMYEFSQVIESSTSNITSAKESFREK